MTAGNLDAARAAHRLLVDRIRTLYPEEDLDSLADTVASESELDLAIVATLRAAIEREAYAAAIGEMIKVMQERKKRLETGAEGMRRAVLAAMVEAAWKRLPQQPPDMTVTVGAGTPKLLITDESALPFDLLEVVSRPNRAAIKEALKAGRAVEGATLGNSEPHLIVSRR